VTVWQAVKSVFSQSFWQRAVPVLMVVLSFNVLVQLHWVRENLPFIHRGQLRFHRLLCSLAPRPITAKWVRMVEINDDLHQQLGEPTNRGVLAALVRNAVAGDATVVVLDFKLISPPRFADGQDVRERTDQNRALLQAIQDASDKGVPVVVPCWLKQTGDRWERWPSIYLDRDLPLADEHGQCAHRACARLGNINLPTDERRIPLVAPMQASDPCSESLALAAATAYDLAFDRVPLTRDKKIIKDAIAKHEFVFGSFIPEDDAPAAKSGPGANPGSGSTLPGFQKTSAEKLANLGATTSAENAAARAQCRGRIVVIGGKWRSDLGRGEFADRYDTPAGPMTGMYVHANYIEALLDDRYQPEVPLWAAIGFDLLIGGALYLSFHKASTRRGKLLVLGVFLAPLVASYVVFANLNLYLDFILPLGACFVHLVVEFARDYWRLKSVAVA